MTLSAANSNSTVTDLLHNNSSSSHSSSLLDWENIQGKLYDREEQKARLIEAYQRRRRCCSEDVDDRRININNSTSVNGSTISTIQQQQGVVLITGESGSGKTELAQAFRQYVLDDGGYFLSGKCDPLAQDLLNAQPYGAFVSALTDFVNFIVQEDDKRMIPAVKAAIEATLDSEISVLQRVLPALDQILMSSSSQTERWKTSMNGVDAESRFSQIVCKFLRAICSDGVLLTSSSSSSTHLQSDATSNSSSSSTSTSSASTSRPLVLFMDDIQWANESSIEMLRHLALDRENHKLLLVCACRSDAVAFDDPLSQMLRHVEDAAGVPITEIQLSNVQPHALQAMVSDLLHILPNTTTTTTTITTTTITTTQTSHDQHHQDDDGCCKDLAAILYQKTNGNVFFAMQLLRLWNEQGLLHKEQENNGIWNWCDKDLEDDMASSSSPCKTMQQVLQARIQQLPRAMRENLQAAACVGNEISMDILFEDQTGAMLSSSSSSSSSSALLNMTRQDLDLAERFGLIVVDPKAEVIRFTHDKIHQAVYHLIPECQRAATHLAIGRDMWNLLQQQQQQQQQHQHPDPLEKHIFLLCNQLIRGVELLDNQDERNCLAALLYQAGQKAIGLSAFLAAATYFNVGISLLSPNHWNDNYGWSLELYNSAAEVEYCIGHLDRVDHLLGEVFRHARQFDDRLRSYNLRIHALGARNELGTAIAEGFDVLQSLGERFPSSAGASQIAIDFVRTMWTLRGKSDKDILHLPTMVHKSGLEVIRFLTLTLAYVRWKKPEFVPLVAMRIIRLTLRNGLTGMSSVGFATLGVLLVTNGKEDEGTRYGRLALTILNKFQARDLECRVHTIVFGMIHPSSHALRDSIKPLLAAHRTGLVTGDIQFSMVAAAIYAGMIICTGAPLFRITQEIQTFRMLCDRYGQDSVTAMLNPLHQMCLNFMGRSQNPVVLTGSIMNEDVAFQEAESRSSTNLALLIHFKCNLATFMHDHQLVDRLSTKMRNLKRRQLIPCSMDIHRFQEGLTAAALSTTSKKHAKLARQNLDELKKHAERAPWNLRNKISLLEAELLTVAGKFEEALIKYDESIDHASREMFLHEQALACEKAGLSRLRCSRTVEALNYFERARVLYRTWDAHIKVEQLTSIMDGLQHELLSAQLNDPSFLISSIRTLTA